MNHILIFKTNVDTDEQLLQAGLLLNTNTSITKWNIDREDIDKVLRIEATEPHTDCIVQLLQDAGFLCEELTD